MKVALEPEQEQFVKLQIHRGRYATAEQVISSALKLLEESQRQKDEKRLEELRQKIAVGTEQIQRGQVTDGEVVFARMQDKIRKIVESEQ